MKTNLAIILLVSTLLGCSRGSVESGSVSKDETMEGLPEHLMYVYTSETSETATSSPEAQRQLYDGSKRWESGRTLKVCTFAGNPVVATLIREVAIEWNQYSSVKLDFGTAPGGYNCLSPNGGFFQIRIGFSDRGYWSAVGSDSETRFDSLAPTMNLAQFNFIYSASRYTPANVVSSADRYHKAVILHEFGHALGLLHEHQNPSLKCHDEIIWSGPGNVYAYFARPPNEWSEGQVNRNLGYVSQTDPEYVSEEPDLESIMMYSLPAAIFRAGANGQPNRCAVPKNYAISMKDKQIVAKIYPLVGAASPQGGVVMAPVSAGMVEMEASPASVPVFAPSFSTDDLLARVKADIESDDVVARRNARVRLASLLKNPTAQGDVSKAIAEMAEKTASYRFQLGVSSAIARSPEIKLSAADKKNLSDLARGAKDATLKGSLEAAAHR